MANTGPSARPLQSWWRRRCTIDPRTTALFSLALAIQLACIPAREDAYPPVQRVDSRNITFSDLGAVHDLAQPERDDGRAVDADKADSSVASPDTSLPEGVLLSIDHDEGPANVPLTDSWLRQQFSAFKIQSISAFEKGTDRPDNPISLVPDPNGDSSRGLVMKVNRVKGTYSYQGPSGGQWQINLDPNGDGWDELYFSYDYMHVEAEPYTWPAGIKLTGLAGVNKDEGGDLGAAAGGAQGGTPDGTNAFSARMMWYSKKAYPGKPNGALAGYLYWANNDDGTPNVQKNVWADDGPDGFYAIPQNQWITIEQRVKLNTVRAPGDYDDDGEFEVWVDGVLVARKKNIRWSTTPSLKVNWLYFLFGYGGSCTAEQLANDDCRWAAPVAMWDYYDNWTVSTKPITH